MSRSALWRQEAGVKEREQRAEDLFLGAVEEGRSKPKKALVPLHGPDGGPSAFNFNPMLLANIIKSQYFQKSIDKLGDWNAVVDEIYYEVKHCEPWTPDHVDSPYIRLIGFLYLRYACDPALLWGWFQPYLYDEQRVRVRSNPSAPEISVGEFVRGLLEGRDYHGTMLPRLPVAAERDVKVKLLQAQQIEDRARTHLANPGTMEYLMRPGARIRALYGDEENPVAWYDGVIDRVIREDAETGEPLSRPKFVVTFPEYGNTETVTLGEVDLSPEGGAGGVDSSKGGGGDYGRDYDGGRERERGRSDRDAPNDRDRDRGRGRDWGSDDRDRGRGYGRDERGYGRDRRYGDNRGYDRHEIGRGHGDDERWERDRHRSEGDRGYHDDRGAYRQEQSHNRGDDENLMQEVLRREREQSTAKGKAYAARPATFKESLSVSSGAAASRASGRDGERSTSPRRGGEASGSYGGDKSGSAKSAVEAADRDGGGSKHAAAKREMTDEEKAAVQEKRRRLMAKYG